MKCKTMLLAGAALAVLAIGTPATAGDRPLAPSPDILSDVQDANGWHVDPAFAKWWEWAAYEDDAWTACAQYAEGGRALAQMIHDGDGLDQVHEKIAQDSMDGKAIPGLTPDQTAQVMNRLAVMVRRHGDWSLDRVAEQSFDVCLEGLASIDAVYANRAYNYTSDLCAGVALATRRAWGEKPSGDLPAVTNEYFAYEAKLPPDAPHMIGSGQGVVFEFADYMMTHIPDRGQVMQGDGSTPYLWNAERMSWAIFGICIRSEVGIP